MGTFSKFPRKHATLATGAHPSVRGMVNNTWFDRATGQMTCNIEDARYPPLSAGADVDKATEIDPTQKVCQHRRAFPGRHSLLHVQR